MNRFGRPAESLGRYLWHIDGVEEDEGRLIAEAPGFRPPMRPGDGTDTLSESLARMRDEEQW